MKGKRQRKAVRRRAVRRKAVVDDDV